MVVLTTILCSIKCYRKYLTLVLLSDCSKHYWHQTFRKQFVSSSKLLKTITITFQQEL